MTIHVHIAPAGAGKTEECIRRVRAASRERPLAPVWACLPDNVQASAFRRRLAEAGGALGVEVGTFIDLYRETLWAAGQLYPEVTEPVQHRLLRAVIDRAAAEGSLQHYLPLRDKPGFVPVLRRLIEELKRARVEPAELAAAVRGLGPRLEELAALYDGYQGWLLERGWVDGEGLGWLATRALERRHDLLAHWGLVVVDGFDDLDPLQIAFLAALGAQVSELVITLTGAPGPDRLAHRRFRQALERLQAGLGVAPEPLPEVRRHPVPALARLEAGLFAAPAGTADPGPAVIWLEAPNRPTEVRAVLRWVKQRLVYDRLAPAEVAVLAREVAPYLPLLLEAAEEMGLPLAPAGGLPLASNPAVAALMALWSLPRRDQASAAVQDGRFPVRQLLEALRCPYFSWSELEVDGRPLRLTAEDADSLEQAAAAAQVLAGLDQWREALAMQAAQVADVADAEERGEGPAAAAVAPGEGWAGLAARFESLVARLTPPDQETVAGFTAFLEELIGDEPQAGRGGGSGLAVVANVHEGPPELVERDLQALRRLKEALRGLVWAAELLGERERLPYERFLDELAATVSVASYSWRPQTAGGAVRVASVLQARGLSFGAVAIVGLCEGEFPPPPPTDVLLRPGDRQRLVEQGLPLGPPAPGGEFTLFYEAVTRARERLLLSRPYLGEAGQPWRPSPFWEDSLRLFAGNDEAAQERLVARVRAADGLPAEEAGSWMELAVAVAQGLRMQTPGAPALAAALAGDPERSGLWLAIAHGAEVLAARLQRPAAGPFEGECAALAAALAARYAPERPWSASRLEAYRSCPLGFYLGKVLELERREPARVGFDAAQLGSIYHAILEGVYLRAASGERQELLAALPAVAEEVLSWAPRAYGFRPSQLWEQDKARIREECANTVRALAEAGEGWQPLRLELRFGLPGESLPAPWVEAEGGRFRLRGIIDRVDAHPAGGLRVIDYKSGGQAITARHLLEGKRLQLALYAWAAQQALGETVTSGHYWHIRKAACSSLTLEGLDGGAAQAMAVAAAHAWEAIGGVLAGCFSPEPDDEGCPDYCPGAGFCWRYAPKRFFGGSR